MSSRKTCTGIAANGPRAGRCSSLAGDFDADPDANSVRFWAGRAALGDISVCYRDAWEGAHPGESGDTFTPGNPLMTDWDWPFRRIEYNFVRCGKHGGPTLRISAPERIFDEPMAGVWASDHFGVMADLAVPPQWPVGGARRATGRG